MYVVMVYDLEADRTQKALKLGRRYLTHVQNSVLEGEISEGDLATLKNEVDDLLNPSESTIIYELSSDTLLNRTVYGDDPTEDQRFL
ncbi:CRISPR-associated protein, Cas2 family [Halopenitus malekzadehii]|uniref:CRISPR-associated endoribonuclease Cas2 n=1 Tax=Halopenitus malekzadehii TaxID=1267564 RepID=A0A1H6JRK5_9EURY|nr:CRISPR-associated endonuclease Cas2 [Halopenitus malekzadehii]SEH65140.1 CRISPR-associated protein, Cas2 family [Halopenitus malekzadehii]